MSEATEVVPSKTQRTQLLVGSIFGILMAIFILYPLYYKNPFYELRFIKNLFIGPVLFAGGIYLAYLYKQTKAFYIRFDSNTYEINWLLEKNRKLGFGRVLERTGPLSELKIGKSEIYSPKNFHVIVVNNDRILRLDDRSKNAKALLEELKNREGI